MHWESTDNFGNLSVATSEAEDIGELRLHLQSMISEVFQRTSENVTFAIDVSYQEIAAPDENQVTHVLTVPLLTNLGEAAVKELLSETLDSMGKTAQVRGPW